MSEKIDELHCKNHAEGHKTFYKHCQISLGEYNSFISRPCIFIYILVQCRVKTRLVEIYYINFNQYLPATCFLIIYSSYQCPVNFGKDSRLIIRCVNGDFTNKHSNSFH